MPSHFALHSKLPFCSVFWDVIFGVGIVIEEEELREVGGIGRDRDHGVRELRRVVHVSRRAVVTSLF